MALTFASTRGATDGVTPVVMLAAQGSGATRIVRNITVYNADTASVTVTVTQANDVADRILTKTTLGAGDTLTMSGPYVTATSGDGYEVVLAAAKTTTDCDWTLSYSNDS